MTDAGPPDAAWDRQLLAVRRLATSLVRDEFTADDLAQEAVLRALREDRRAAPRAWWLRVMRNLLRDGARRDRARTAGEADLGRGSASPPTHEVVAEIETNRRVTDALLALEEPYRTVMLLRHARDLPPRTIAREVGRPVGTVKVQLERGRALLRQRLERELGGPGPLAVALLPLVPADRAAALAGASAAPPLLAGPLVAGALLMNAKWLVAGVVAIAVSAWTAVEVTRTIDLRRPPESEGAEAVAPRIVDAGEESAPSMAEPSSLTRRAAAVDAEADSRQRTTLESPSAAGGAEIRGRALLLDGTPIPGFRVSASGFGNASVMTDEDGSFVLGGLAPGVYDLELDVSLAKVLGAKRSDVSAPSEGLELRLNALLVDLVVGEEIEKPESLFMSVAVFGGPQRGTSTYGGRSFDDEGRAQRLVPSGYGCLFKAEDGDQSVSVAGLLEPGLLSGAYEVELQENAPGLGTVRAELIGASVEFPDRVYLHMRPEEESFEGGAPVSGGSVTVSDGERFGVETNVFPGSYRLSVSSVDLPPLEYWIPVPRTDVVHVKDGAVATIEVDMLRGGRVGLFIETPTTGSVPEPRLQRWDEETAGWLRVGVAWKPGEDQFAESNNAPLATECWSDRPLPPGPTRLRLVGNGWETLETTLEVVAGETVPWRPRLLRDG
ncbi:MAG: sigma-70 family RNA polymerase sigma factor [Planctomycetota bacterium]